MGFYQFSFSKADNQSIMAAPRKMKSNKKIEAQKNTLERSHGHDLKAQNLLQNGVKEQQKGGNQLTIKSLRRFDLTKTYLSKMVEVLDQNPTQAWRHSMFSKKLQMQSVRMFRSFECFDSIP